MSSLNSLAVGSVCRDLIEPPSDRPCHCAYYVANDTCYDIDNRGYEIENQIKSSENHFQNKLEGPALENVMNSARKSLQEEFNQVSKLSKDELEGCDHCAECFAD